MWKWVVLLMFLEGACSVAAEQKHTHDGGTVTFWDDLRILPVTIASIKGDAIITLYTGKDMRRIMRFTLLPETVYTAGEEVVDRSVMSHKGLWFVVYCVKCNGVIRLHHVEGL